MRCSGVRGRAMRECRRSKILRASSAVQAHPAIKMSHASLNVAPASRSHFTAVLAAPELTVVVPTFNERTNIPILVRKLDASLTEVNWEVIIVDDDSPDGTAAVAKSVGELDARVRCIRRVGRRGLAGACIEGMLASNARYIAVMDADLQHDEAMLGQMLQRLRGEQYDLVIGSRYLAEGHAEGLSRRRLLGSRVATVVVRRILGVDVTDPLSGFFMARREVIERLASNLSVDGFKILADILTTAHGNLRICEIPFRFRARMHGSTKLDSRVALDFVGLLVSKATANAIPVRFVSFSLVGGLGVLVHLVSLKASLSSGLEFLAAQTIATFVAMTSNFFLNNALTYRDQRLSGAAAVKGLSLFYLICLVGAASNIGVANWLYVNEPVWWLAGLLGSIVGAVWNYAVSSTLVWRRRNSATQDQVYPHSSSVIEERCD
jgi:dolichol-phosphate mannosyltransferase